VLKDPVETQLKGLCRHLLEERRKAKKTTGCPTRYRTRHFFNNFTTNEDIATKFETDLPHCVRNVKENNVLLFKFRCNIFIGVRIIKEMPESVASGTPCRRRYSHDCTKVLLCSLIVLQWPMILTNEEKHVLCSNKISLYDRLHTSVIRQVPLDHVHRSSATGTGYEEEQGQPIRQKADKFLTRTAGTLDRALPRLSTFICYKQEIINGSHWPFRNHIMQNCTASLSVQNNSRTGIWFSWDLTSDSATAMCLYSLVMVEM